MCNPGDEKRTHQPHSGPGGPDAFHSQFAHARNHLMSLDVAFVEIDNPLGLYLFEPYCALELDTGFEAGGWNTFDTH